MAPSHVPNEHLPLQDQSIYTNPAFTNLPFAHSAEHFNPQWTNGQLEGIVDPTQNWHHNPYLPQQSQPYGTIGQPYQNQNQALRAASPYQYSQFTNHTPIPSYGHAANVDPALGVDANALRQQQQSPYAVGLRNGSAQTPSSTVTPQALQQNLPVQNPRPTAPSYQVSSAPWHLPHRKTHADDALPLQTPTPRPAAELFASQRPVQTVTVQPKKNPEYEVPKARKSGAFVVFDQPALAEATNSTALNKFVTLGSDTFHLPSNRSKPPSCCVKVNRHRI